MKERLLIVEDEFIVANDLRLMLVHSGYEVCAIAETVEAAKHCIEKYKPTWVLLDILLQENQMGTDLAQHLTERNIGFIYISANTNQGILDIAKATQPYGFLVKPFRKNDLLIMLDIVRNKHLHNLQFTAQRELLYRNQLRHITKFNSDPDHFLSFIPGLFQTLLPFDLMTIHVRYQKRNKTAGIGFLQTGFEEYELLPGAALDRLTQSVRGSIENDALTSNARNVQVLNGKAFQEHLAFDAVSRSLSLHFQLESKLSFAQRSPEEHVIFSFYSRKPDAYTYQHLHPLVTSEEPLRDLATLLSRFLLEKHPSDPSKSIRVSGAMSPTSYEKFPGIIGKSPYLLQVLHNIELVANTPVSVLILGESGTGKEQIAHSIHQLSARKNKPFITVNCAALPAQLIESELFGHEKGAFTGAIEKRTGKFETADGGTIFLDEIGELPLGSQVKLLRVLQEMEFEPVGSSKTIKVDVRVVAATNRNLEKDIAENTFRLDLYYRLNVFPVALPPLRDRKEDIPLLVDHFLRSAAEIIGRPSVPEIGPKILQQLKQYHWPGNIRELKHFLERTLIRNQGPVIVDIELPVGPRPAALPGVDEASAYKTLEENEAEYILRVVRDCNGKVFGSGGAAEILGIPPSTLSSRMKKLGIRKELLRDKTGNC